MSGDREIGKHSSSSELALGASSNKRTIGCARQAYSDSKINRRGLSSTILSFHNAVRNNDLCQVQQFLEGDIDPDVQDVNTGKFPLLEATKMGHVDIVKALLGAHANINQTNIQGTTALHACFDNKNFNREIARVFLEQSKTNYNLQEKTTGNTPLHVLCRVSASNNANQDAIREILKEIVPGSQVNLQNKAGNTPLHFMVLGKREDSEAVRILLDAKADLNMRNHFGETPLAAAIGNRKIKLAMTILEYDVDINVKDRCGHTLLHYAAKKNSPLIIKRLLEKGSDVNAKDPYGDTALHLSAGRGYVDAMAELLKHEDIRVNARNENGYTPLMCAVDGSFIKAVELLMKFKCDVFTCTPYNKTALDIARRNMLKRGKREIYEILSRYASKCLTHS